MVRVFLSLGSNLGDRRQFLESALDRLAGEGQIRVVARSDVYETEPWPEHRVARDRWYLNCVVEIETSLGPRPLLHLLHAIEAGAGRVRAPAPSPGYQDRTLDIDILLYGDRVMSDEDLQIPHPFLHERRFVLAPLAELAPNVEHPVLYQSIRDLLAALLDPRQVARHQP